MQLDRTRIAIRERGIQDLLDLSLKVTRTYLKALAVATAAIALPLAVVNWFLLDWIVAEELTDGAASRYVWLMAQLVFLEAPLATLATTSFLGKVMFSQPTKAMPIARDLVSLAPRILWTHLILRGVIIGWFLAFTITPMDDVSPAEIFLPLLCFAVAFYRALRPYMNEIVVLEKNPLRATDPKQITVNRRSSMLHNPSSGELMGRYVTSCIAIIGVVVSLAFSLWFCWGMMFNNWNWTLVIVRIFIPTAMWAAVVFSAVLRFLCYLDLRIYREGWEVELKMRAAANSMTKVAA